MPTYAELAREPWWRDEYEPPALAKLNADLRQFYNLGPIAIGSKGDNRHLSGYHRSRAWLQNSVYCTNRKYSVSETEGNRSGGNSNWLAAIDMTIPAAKMYPACRRLDAACRAGTLEKVTQWFGSFDGKTVVGWNNVQNRPATSDASHLWHIHLSLDRGRVGEDHSDLFSILTGDPFMALTDADQQALIYRVEALIANRPAVAGGPTMGEPNVLHAKLAEIDAQIEALAVSSGLDPAALKAAVQEAIQAETPAIAEAVADEQAARLSE